MKRRQLAWVVMALFRDHLYATAFVRYGAVGQPYRLRQQPLRLSRVWRMSQQQQQQHREEEEEGLDFAPAPHCDGTSAAAAAAAAASPPLSLSATLGEDDEEERGKRLEGGEERGAGGSTALAAVPAAALLNAVTILWGTQHAVIKLAVTTTDSPAELNFARFFIAALLCAPLLPSFDNKAYDDSGSSRSLPDAVAPAAAPSASSPGGDYSPIGDTAASASAAAAAAAAATPAAISTSSPLATWRAGAELGVWMFLGYAFQAVGLQTTSASRSCFLLYLNVKLVPIFSSVFLGRRVPLLTWGSAALALTGTALVANDGSPPVVGDAWSLAAAVASAGFILRLEALAPRCPARQLNAASLASVAALCGAWALVDAWPGTAGGGTGAVAASASASSSAAAAAGEQLWTTLSQVSASLGDLAASSGPAVLYLAVVTTALCNWLQTVGQARIGAEQAALIYALDPVWGAFFARILCGDELGGEGIAGGALIVIAAIGSQFLADSKTNPLSSEAEADEAEAAAAAAAVPLASSDSDEPEPEPL